MLEDRPYMRSGSDEGSDFHMLRNNYPVLTWLLFSNILVFVLQHVLIKLFDAQFMQTHFSLSFAALSEFRIWTFLSYGFLHAGMFHALANMLGLFFIGRELEPMLGSRRFGILFFSGVLVGGLLWLLVSAVGEAPLYGARVLMGASAGVMALLIYFCRCFPERSITLLLFFVLPINLKPKWVFWFSIGWGGIGVLMELSNSTNVAHSAHMGGIAAALVLYHIYQQGAGYGGSGWLGQNKSSGGGGGGISIEPPRWLKNKKTRSTSGQKYKVNMVSRKEMEEEVDRILDKINKKGFGSLTLEEKEKLDRAKEFLDR